MTLQTYVALWPVSGSAGNVAPGGTIQLDDADPTTIQMLRNKVIELQSSPTQAADLAADQADAAYTTAHGVNPFKDYRGEQSQEQNPPTQPLEGVDGDDALRYQ